MELKANSSSNLKGFFQITVERKEKKLVLVNRNFSATAIRRSRAHGRLTRITNNGLTLRTFQRRPSGQQDEILVFVQVVRVVFHSEHGVHGDFTVNGVIDDRGALQVHAGRVLDPAVLLPVGHVPRFERTHTVAPAAFLVHALDDAISALGKHKRIKNRYAPHYHVRNTINKRRDFLCRKKTLTKYFLKKKKII